MYKVVLLWLTLTALAYSYGVDTDIIYQINDKYAVTGRLIRFVNKENPSEGVNPDFRRINRSIDGRFNEIKREVISSALQFADEFPNSNLLPFTLNSSYYITHNTMGLMSFVVETTYYTGGAHPNIIIDGYTVDRNTYYDLDTFFHNPEKAREYITGVIQDEISRSNNAFSEKRGEKIYFDEVRADLKDAVFYLEGDDIVFVFQRYTIAPYSSGNPRFEVPLKSLKKFLHKRWTVF